MKDSESMSVEPVRRRVGRPRKSDTKIVSESKVKSKLLPVLKLDLTKEPSQQILGLTDREQAKHLGWKTEEVRSVNSFLGLYESLPMVCQAEECYYASQCPTKPDFKFKGYLCPLQTMDVYRFFLGYILDLDIHPTDYVDLRLVEDLVRIDLQLKTVDQKVQMIGLETDTVGGIIQSTGLNMGGKAVYEKTVHPLLLLQDKLRSKRKDIHKGLIANRAEKLERDRKDGKAKEDAFVFMDRLLASYQNKTKASVREERTSIEGEVVSDDYQEDEE